jgi:hypothetical protein
VHRRTLSAATTLAVLFSSVALIATGAGSAVADSSTTLPLKSTGDIVVDGVHQRVFISDPTAGQVVVTDYAGTVVATVGSLPGVHGLELSPDSGTLYAAVHDATAIVAIDTATATETRRWSTGQGAGPAYVALAGGKLWFSYGASGDGNIGSLDPNATDPGLTLGQDTSRTFYEAPILDASPGAPGTLAAGAPGQSPVELAVYDVSSGTASRTAYARISRSRRTARASSRPAAPRTTSRSTSSRTCPRTASTSRTPIPTRWTSPRTATSRRARSPGTTRTSTSSSRARRCH